MNEKICNKCKKVKNLELFGKRTGAKDGRRNECKNCKSIENKRLNPRYVKKAKNSYLKRTYGISNIDYNLLIEKQNGLCAICKCPETRSRDGKLTELAVDHCHETGKIRGLLCQKCNSGIGMFKESINLLKQAIEYMENLNK